MTLKVGSFSDVEGEFFQYIGDIAYATMITVDRKNRPRARVLLPVWELYRKGSPPGVGYDPRGYWHGGPTDPEYHVVRIEPWRVQVLRGTDLRSRIWTAEGGA
ncbi:hypothetical protein ACFV2X_30720 [Streptomyces sp. NPDC059679]|uniref:hypothetical protein n=1 Tax=Streptomyces sp. NPDC059679 TaxID=3346903 RepID=UPI00367C24D4